MLRFKAAQRLDYFDDAFLSFFWIFRSRLFFFLFRIVEGFS
jgi:hypothetical protein